MDHKETGRYWNANAEAWTKLARAGYDVYRDYLNTPAFFAMLPDVRGLAGLDIGCGEGHNTRLLAQRGARMTAIDITEVFLTYAQQAEVVVPLGITYSEASAVELPFPDQTFDFTTGVMSFMDIPDTERVVAEAHRVLKPGGFLQFSILHPCFMTPHRRNLRTAHGQIYAIEVGEYFRTLHGEIEQWLFATVPAEIQQHTRPFIIPRFSRTLSQWFNLLIASGFVIERVEEPNPSEEAVHACPTIADAQITAFFLHIRVRKPRMQ